MRLYQGLTSRAVKAQRASGLLLMTAKLMSGSVCFEPISKSALYQGTTSVVPKRASRTRALAPAALLPSQFGLGQRSAAQPASRTLPLQHSIAPEVRSCCMKRRA